jgi:hypothetical protein
VKVGVLLEQRVGARGCDELDDITLVEHDLRGLHRVSLRKTPLFFEFSLCLSRACLGKMFLFVYKWLKSGVFRTGW